MGAKSEEEEVKLPEMDLEENVELQGLDAGEQEAPRVVKIDDPKIPPDPHPI